MIRSAHLWWGITLIALGVLFLLDNMDIVDVGYLLHTFWPLIFIIWGAGILLRKDTPKPDSGTTEEGGSRKVVGDTDEETRTHEIDYSTVFGDCTVRISSEAFRGGSVSTVFGDTEIDCSRATVNSGEQRLSVKGVFGDAELWLSRDTAFRLTSSTVFGTIRCNDQKQEGFSPSLQYESPGYGAAERRLRIDISQVFGDVTVRTR
jgi:predicted membrane protein